jgi:hypothetical protein
MVNGEAAYQVVAARRAQQDALMWQVPVLSLTAQAFLFTIALGSGSTSLARAVAALLSMVTAALSMMLMGKHRVNELHDALWLDEYEQGHGLPPVHSRPYLRDWGRENKPRWVPRSLYVAWLTGLGLFGVAGLVVIVLVVAAPHLLTG